MRGYMGSDALFRHCTELQQELDHCRRVLRAHHDWSLTNIPGYKEGGEDQLIYRATIIALGGNEAVLALRKTTFVVPDS